MENAFNSSDEFAKRFNEILIDFCLNDCSEYSNFDELKEASKQIEIKNNRNAKIAKFTLQINAFIYQRLMDFPLGEFEYETLTTSNVFENIDKLINVKIHLLHHLHITEKIYSKIFMYCVQFLWIWYVLFNQRNEALSLANKCLMNSCLIYENVIQLTNLAVAY